LVDLPGYGYAEVPEPIRLQWQNLLEHYLIRAKT
jgi:GTP-binding protein